VVAATTVVITQLASNPKLETKLPGPVYAAGDPAASVSTVSSYNSRKDSFISALLGHNHDDVIAGIGLLEQAARTGNMSRVREANDILVVAARTIDDPDYKGDKRPAYEGYALPFLNVVLKYGSRPDLLYPATLLKLKEGIEPSGSGYANNTNESLRYFMREVAFSDSRQIGVGKYNPWTNLGQGTENHKLQEIATGIMLSRVYEGEKYTANDGTYAWKDNTDTADDYYHYWINAFYRWLFMYGERDTGEALTRHVDYGIGEKDSSHYMITYIGDLWLIRDYAADVKVAKYAEIYLDLMLADMAEETIGGIYTGSHSRGYDTLTGEYGLRHNYQSPITYLLYGDLPYPPTSMGSALSSWGGWANGAILTSDYNPTSSQFPMVVTDIQVNKSSTLFNSKQAETIWSGLPADYEDNWIGSRYSIGFQEYYGCGASNLCGGVFINDNVAARGGAAVVPFVGDVPDYRYNPDASIRGVIGSGVGLIKLVENDPNANQTTLPTKLWIKGKWGETATSGQWMFYRTTAFDGKYVYVAVRPALGGTTTGTSVDGGVVKVLTTQDDFWVFDVADQDKFASLTEFKNTVLAKPFSTTWPWIDYTSSGGVRVKYNRSNHTKYVNEVMQTTDEFKYGLKNPWMEWKFGAREASFSRNGRTAFYDFDANNDGVFNDPVKTVNNGGGGVITGPTPTPVQPTPTTSQVVPTPTPLVGGATPTPIPNTSTLITGLTVMDTVNGVDWSVQNNLGVGGLQFGDRTYKFTNVPSLVSGAEWIRTAADSKSFTLSPVIEFVVGSAARVYVAHDNRVSTKPSWMSTWVDTGVDVLSDAPGATGFSLYYKDYASGNKVSLGENGNITQLMYTIIVVPSSSVIPTSAPTTIPTSVPTSVPTPTSGVISNLLTNGTFSTNSSGWWGLTDPVGTATFGWDGGVGRTGLGSLKSVASNATLARWMTNNASVAATPGKTYTLTGYVKTSSVTGKGAYALINFWNGTSSAPNYLSVYGKSTYVLGTNDWMKVTATAVAPAGTTWLRVELRTEGSGSAYWDDVVVQ
jgi:hypothetical protein